MNQLFIMSVELPKDQSSLLRVCKTIRRAYNAFHVEDEINTHEANELAQRVQAEGPVCIAETEAFEQLISIRDAMLDDAPELTVAVNPTAEELRVDEPADAELDAIAHEVEHQGALAALALMGAVEGDPVAAVGLTATLGNITGHDSFRHATVLLSEAYQIQVVSESSD